jgi:RHS repeat-associated protein
VGSPLTGSLVIPGSPVESEQLQAERQARSTNPVFIAEREASRTKFAGLGVGQARALAAAQFPGLVSEPAGGLPRLAGGERITRFPSDHAASVELSGGRHGLIESLEPVAVKEASGQRVPVNLSLRSVGDGYESVAPVVAVRIPRRLGEGVQLGDTGVSVTPVGQSGSPLHGSEGLLTGASVFYGSTQLDTDTVIKPTASGFEASAILRSAQSSGRIAYRVSMPKDARLVQSGASGGVQVIEHGTVLAGVLPAAATDATGAGVPVSMSVSGDILTIAVHLTDGQWTYPIAVDPYYYIFDNYKGGEGYPSNWILKGGPHGDFALKHPAPTIFMFEQTATAPVGEYAEATYSTQGESRVAQLEAEILGNGAPGTESFMRILKGSLEHVEWEVPRGKSFDESRVMYAKCDKTSCKVEKLEFEELGLEENAATVGIEAYQEVPCCGGSLTIDKDEVLIWQAKGSEAHVNKTSETIDGKRNVLEEEEGWLGPNSNSVFEVEDHDPGVGIDEAVTSAGGWSEHYEPLEKYQCSGPECPPNYDPVFAYNSKMANGEDELSATAQDAMPETEGKLESGIKLKVDDTKPHGIKISGLPSSDEIGEGVYDLKAEATDGTGTTKVAGIHSITVAIDGREVGFSNGTCLESLECTAKGEWVIAGASIGVGEHKLTVTATDFAGNTETATYTLKVHHAAGLPIGPGTVNPQSGVFSTTATDVAIPVPGGSLSVTRDYQSGAGEQGREGGITGPLGPKWSLAVGGQESIVLAPNGNATLMTASGGATTFALAGGKYTAPTGDSNLSLTEVIGETGPEFLLKDAANGDTTRFTATTGDDWTPVKQEGPLSSQTVRYTFQTKEGVTEPVHAFAPEPPGVTCGEESKTWVAGCRVLTFEYAAATTATGEKPSEWKAFKGRLEKITYTAYNQATKAMTTVTVADYSYDYPQGRLRAVWNPEISPVLKTTYGWEETLLTAVNPAGQEPWLLNYGPGTSEQAVWNPGSTSLLSVIRPAAATPAELKTQEEEAPPSNTTAPSLSSEKPTVGSKITISHEGTWTNSPLTYRYRWLKCKLRCYPIPGAVNQSYYPTTSVEGLTLEGQVIAYNANGAQTAESAETEVVYPGTPNSPAPEPPAVGTSSVWTVDYQVPLSGVAELPTMTQAAIEKWGQKAEEKPEEATAIFPPDSPEGWPAKTYARATVRYLDSRSRTVNVATPTGGVSTTEFNADNDVIRTLSPDNRALALKETCESKCKSAELAKALSTESTYEEKGSEPGTELLSTLGPEHKVQLTNGTQVEARAHTVYSYDEGMPGSGGPYHLVTKMTQGAMVAGTEEPVSVRTTVNGYSGTGSQENLGWKLRKPTSVTTDPSGLDLVHVTEFEPSTGEVKETKMPAATGHDEEVPPAYRAQFGTKGAGADQTNYPFGVAVDGHGDVWASDVENNRVDEFSSTGSFMEAIGFGVNKGNKEFEVCTTSCKAGISGSEAGEFDFPAGVAFYGGYLYVADYGNDRIDRFNEKSEREGSFGTKGTGPGQFEAPVAVAVNSSGDIWVGDDAENRLSEFSSGDTFIEAIGFGVNKGNKEFETCTTTCKAGIAGSGNGQFDEAAGITFVGKTMFVAEFHNERVQEFNEKYEYAANFGSKGTGNGQFEAPEGIATAGGNLYVTDIDAHRVQVFTTSGTYLSQFGFKGSGTGQLKEPAGIAAGASGEIYVADTGNYRVEEWVPTDTGNEGAHDTKTIYYTAKTEAEVSTCQNHPEWAGLVCETEPAAQPGTSGLPELPVIVYGGYNIWQEPTTITETVGTTAPIPTRTKTFTYDGAGRPKTVSVTATEGTAMSTVTDGYTAKEGAETGALTTQSTVVEGKTITITSVLNTRGEQTSYTDASGVTSTYEWDEDERIHKINDGKGTQTFAYSKTTGLPSELLDSAHEGMKFTATWDLEGKQLTETFPNGMTAYHTFDSTGAAISLEYKKLTDCTEEKEKCKWFTDTVVPSIHGQWLSQTSTFSKQAYKYNAAGALTEAQSTPTGKDCTARLYALDEDTNRTSMTTRESTSEKCATEGGTIESHTFDSADRLTDPGIAYSKFGDITTLPWSDAGGKSSSENLTSTFYVDNQLDTQTQNGQTFGYNLDPAGRTMETVETGTKTADIASNYEGPGSEPSWTSNTTGETSRNIHGISGQLVAIQNNSETPVLELANLHGDLIATASYSETATELASKADTSEFGVPTLSLPPKYSWLGAIELANEELPSGAIDMGARSYVPEIGRFLQPDPIPGGSANAYSYTFGDPVNSSDPSGEFTASWLDAYLEEWAAGAAGGQTEREEAERRAAEEAAARVAAEIAAQQAALAAESAAGPQYSEEGEEWEEAEEEGEYEYASDRQGDTQGTEEPHLEPAILIQPLGEEMGEGLSEGEMVPVKGGAECFNRAGCRKKDKAEKHPQNETAFNNCVKGLLAAGAIGTISDINPAKAAAACLLGIALG